MFDGLIKKFTGKKTADKSPLEELAKEAIPSVVVQAEPSTATTEPAKETVDVVIQPKENHVCDENCKHEKPEEKEEEKEEVPPLTMREMKYLKRARYGEIAGKFNKAFVLKNRRTGQIAEIRAVSSFHACNIIGWKPNRVVLLETKDIEKEKTPEPETVSQTESKA